MAVAEHAADLRKMLARDLPREVPAVPHPHMENYAPPAERDRLHKLAEEIDRKALDEIKYRLSHLTWGELEEFSKGTGSESKAVWSWATGQNVG